LNRIQDVAISRFVPRPLLRLLGFKKITDVKLGTFVERDITVVEVEIKDFEKVSQNMKSEQIFHLLNEYLKFVGPLIRRHNGFIEKYQGEKFTALFKDAKKGVLSCVDIQSTIDTFNISELFPKIGLGASVHSASALIGVVGEDERVDGAIISSSHKTVKGILNNLALKFNARTLVTKNVMEKCGSSIKNSEHRLLGSISLKRDNSTRSQVINKSNESIEVFEVIQRSDKTKVSSKAQFENGVIQFQNGFYAESSKVFADIFNEDPQDTIAGIYLSRAQQLMSQTRLITQSLQMKDVLHDSELLESFDAFCTKEHSNENITLWRRIEENFKAILDNKERLEYAKVWYYYL
jgi:class 3 adenylate cyclase